MVLLSLTAQARGAELITLRNGYTLQCDHREPEGAKTRLFFDPTAASYVDIETSQIAAVAPAPAAVTPQTPPAADAPQARPAAAPRHRPAEVLSPADLRQVLGRAGSAHDLSVDLLASVVHAESSGHLRAVSRAGAEGLMQLMPATAASLGVHDAFAAEDNVGGGAAYLDALLRRYHENLAFALAAYNAGPAAVDRWHGIPPYRETRAYVARIIHEFNQRYAARQLISSRAADALAMAAPRR